MSSGIQAYRLKANKIVRSRTDLTSHLVCGVQSSVHLIDTGSTNTPIESSRSIEIYLDSFVTSELRSFSADMAAMKPIIAVPFQMSVGTTRTTTPALVDYEASLTPGIFLGHR